MLRHRLLCLTCFPLPDSASSLSRAMSSDLDKEVDQFRERIKSEAEQLVLKKFPRYMLDLDKMLTVGGLHAAP